METINENSIMEILDSAYDLAILEWSIAFQNKNEQMIIILSISSKIKLQKS